MAEVFLIRHPKAHRPLAAEHGQMYGLNEAGREQARVLGMSLMQIMSGVPDIFEHATSPRSAEAAKIIAGTAGIPTPITSQDAFDRTGLTLPQIEEHMQEWLRSKTGLVVAVMSHVAITACIGKQLRWPGTDAGRAELPTGSVTHLTVTEADPDPFIHFYGQRPDALLRIPEHLRY